MKRYLGFILTLLLFLFSSLSSASAQNSPTRSSSPLTVPQADNTMQIQIPKAEFHNGIVSADIEIKNDTKTDLSTIMYGIQILAPRTAIPIKNGQLDTTTNPGRPVGYQDYDFFTLAKGVTVKKHIEYTLGNHMQSGVYTLLVQVRGSDNGILGYQAQTFSLGGDGIFLTIDPSTCGMRVGATSYDLADGPIVNKNEQAVVSCEVSNTTTTTIETQYVLEYAIRSVAFYPTSDAKKEESQQTISIEPGQKKTVTLLLPHPSTPQAYQGYWYFVDKSRTKLSPITSIRWTIPGASATILGVNSDKPSYTAGEKAQVQVIVDPSADLAWRTDGKGTNLDDAKLQVELIGTNGTACGTGEKQLPNTIKNPQWPNQIVSVDVTKDCPQFTVKAAVTDDKKTLAQVQKQYTVLNANQPRQENQDPSQINPSDMSSWIWITITVIILLLLTAVGFFIYRKRKAAASSATVSLMLFAFLLGNIFLQISYAVSEKQPVDSPIESKTASGGSSEQWWANVSNFSAVSSTGRSSFTVNADCTAGRLYIYGYADHAFCSNFRPGLQAQVYIDGQPTTVNNIISPESEIMTQNNCPVFPPNGTRADTGVRQESGYGCPHGPHEFYVNSGNNGGGIRTATADVPIPASGQTPGQHTLEVRVAAGGKHYSSSGGYFIYTTYGWEHIKMVLNYQCGPPIPSVTPTPTTPPVQCGDSCIRDSDCTGDAARLGCTACLTAPGGGGTTCQPPPTPTPTTPPIQCGSTCIRDSDCTGAAARDGCTSCSPNQSGQNVCSAQPSCECDGMDITEVVSGERATVTAYAKAVNGNSQVRSIDFRMVKGPIDAAQTIDQKTNVPVQIVSRDGDTIRYKATWDVTLPTEKNVEYRIINNINCGARFASTTTRSVAGASTTNPDVLTRIAQAIVGLFHPQPTSTPTPKPLAQSKPKPTQAVLADTTNQLQLNPFFFPKQVQKACQTILFRF